MRNENREILLHNYYSPQYYDDLEEAKNDEQFEFIRNDKEDAGFDKSVDNSKDQIKEQSFSSEVSDVEEEYMDDAAILLKQEFSEDELDPELLKKLRV